MNTTAVGESGPTTPMARSCIWRVSLVGATQLLLLEILNQLFVHWRESTAELWTMGFTGALLLVMPWALWPVYRRWRSILIFLPASFLVFLGLGAFDIFYNLHLRPNLGLYREDEWVAQHPGFQWGWRQGMANKLWNKPAAAPFGPEKELMLSCNTEHPFAWIDLNTGKLVYERELKQSPPSTAAPSEHFDLVVSLKNGQIVGSALDLNAVPIFVGGWNLTSAQKVANFWILDKTLPPQQAPLKLTKHRSGLFVFRTREGKMGLLEVLGPSENPAGVKLRYKMLQS